jgi:prolyl oligopeptidase
VLVKTAVWLGFFVGLGFAGASLADSGVAKADSYEWLENTHDAKTVAWVRAQNARTTEQFIDTADFERTRARILDFLDSDARMPRITKLGNYYYNFWKDKEHPRGVWRRTTLAQYSQDQPAWETMLDIDALNVAENQHWVFEGAQCLKPEYRLCLILLSPGGAGETIGVREFDVVTKQFVKHGFKLDPAHSDVAWIDQNAIYVGTDYGPDSLTSSGNPRIVKIWKRGTPLAAATTVYEGQRDDVGVTAYRDLTPGFQRDFVQRAISAYKTRMFLRQANGTLVPVEVPVDAVTTVQREWLLIQLRTAWTVGGETYPSGALLAAKFDDFMAGKRELTALFVPSPHIALSDYTWTLHHLILNLQNDVSNELEVLTPQPHEWKKENLGGAPKLSSIEATGIDADKNDDYFLTVESFLQPPTLYFGTLGQGAARAIKSTPAFFDASKYEASQHFAYSKDGTRIPYFEIDPKGLKADGSHRVLMYGYGGFEISQPPYYSPGDARGWLERGGVYVLANIRGGGEYGPAWHQAAVGANRLRAYEDFAAVAQDLIRRGITNPKHLGAQGISNGGLLMGNMLTLYPQLFGAIACEMPLLDMEHYTQFAHGHAWTDEYGDPARPNELAWLKTFSPYQNLKRDATYPAVLFYTSTNDDLVGPEQARKMAAKMQGMGVQKVWFYENSEGGHSTGANHAQSAQMHALVYEFLWNNLK